MVNRIKSDKIITKYGLFSGYLYFENSKILDVTKEFIPFENEYDYTGLYVSPGFIDIHTHGGAGFDFVDSEEAVIEGANFHLTHGTTSICPTISASPFPVMQHAVKFVDDAMKSGKCKANIIGAHLEGPYLSKSQCGAQCTDFITSPVKADYESLVKNYKSAIARWTYAPENDEGYEFTTFLARNGIVASAGHTNAEYSHIKSALGYGCKLITHLYSCTSTITRKQGFRHLGVIESAFLEDDIFVEIIADGKHLPPELIKLIIKNKGTDRVALVTDSLSLAGTDKTHGFMMETEYIIEDGVCKLVDRSAFAGSIATADRLVRVIVNEVGLPVCEAVKMITAVPAKIMKLNKGSLKSGLDADIVVFDDNIHIAGIFVMGEKIK